MKSSGNSKRSEPSASALSRAARAFAALLATSPTGGLSWARVILKAARHARGKRDDVQRADVDILDFALLVFPAAAPGARHRNERLVGVVVVHHRAVAGLGAAIAEIETFGNFDGGEARGVVADR